MSNELLSNVIDIIDSAHHQRLQLEELQGQLKLAKDQVIFSAETSRMKAQEHIASLKKLVVAALDDRQEQLISAISKIELNAITPLDDCELMINHEMKSATQLMDEGKHILERDPMENIEKMVKLKEHPGIKTLNRRRFYVTFADSLISSKAHVIVSQNSVPEVPGLSDVACISMELSTDIQEKLLDLIKEVGVIIERAPVQITDIQERPGGLAIRWAEFEEDAVGEIGECCLQFGRVRPDEPDIEYEAVYTGPLSTFSVKHIRTNVTYSFRVRCRLEGQVRWSPWSIPCVAATSINHFQWNFDNDEYCTSNEHQTAERVGDGPAVIYSKFSSCTTGQPITFLILDTGQLAPDDGIGLSLHNKEKESLIVPGTVFLTLGGSVYVDGLKMKNKLPPIGRGSSITFETECVSQDKVRVSIEVGEKEVTFDWKINPGSGMMGASPFGTQGFGVQQPNRSFYFAIRFSKEYWKVSID